MVEDSHRSASNAECAPAGTGDIARLHLLDGAPEARAVPRSGPRHTARAVGSGTCRACDRSGRRRRTGCRGARDPSSVQRAARPARLAQEPDAAHLRPGPRNSKRTFRGPVLRAGVPTPAFPHLTASTTETLRRRPREGARGPAAGRASNRSLGRGSSGPRPTTRSRANPGGPAPGLAATSAGWESSGRPPRAWRPPPGEGR